VARNVCIIVCHWRIKDLVLIAFVLKKTMTLLSSKGMPKKR
jgi:hypothetical protein